jgi:ComF family protein
MPHGKGVALSPRPIRETRCPVASQLSGKKIAKAGLEWASRVGNSVADLLFPPHCVTCGRFGVWLCSQCISEVAFIDAPICARCGAPLGATVIGDTVDGSESAAIGHRCLFLSSNLDGLRSAAWLGGTLQKAIHQFKYQDLQSLSGALGHLLAQGWERFGMDQEEFDQIAPIPLHRSRERERGYNQALLLSQELSRHVGCPVSARLLVRTRATSPQVGLGPEERQANVEGAFSCTDRLEGARVLLVDDVLTTGSTLESAGTALRKSGASLVWAYTLARARSGAGEALYIP